MSSANSIFRRLLLPSAMLAGLLVVAITAATGGPSSTPPSVSAAPIATQWQPMPWKAADGTYYITEPGIYSGYHFDCYGISTNEFCVHIWTEGGVQLDNFWVTTTGNAIQADSNTSFTNGEVWAPGGLSANSERNILIDGVIFHTGRGSVGLQDTSGGCEGLSTKRSYGHVIRNSTFINQTGHETVWLKCTQNVSILNNTFWTGGDWSLSLPDSLDIGIQGNVFHVNGGVNWLAIELPRSFNIWIAQNWFVGAGRGWAVYVNSGTEYVTIQDNCIRNIETLSGAFNLGTVARNGYC